jgi:hypothetical protein
LLKVSGGGKELKFSQEGETFGADGEPFEDALEGTEGEGFEE